MESVTSMHLKDDAVAWVKLHLQPNEPENKENA